MNPRMFAIAAALFLGLVVGTGAGQEPVLDLWGEATALIRDVELVPTPEQKVYDPASFQANETLVEGHTVFATIDLRSKRVAMEGNLTIDGVVHCEDRVEIKTAPFLGLPIPTKLERAQVSCYYGQRVFVTPDPFSGDPGSLGGGTTMSTTSPSGQFVFFTTPDGQSGYAEEFVTTVFDADGRSRDYYSWAVPVMKPWITESGKTKNFMLPLPLDRLHHNNVSDYRVDLES